MRMLRNVLMTAAATACVAAGALALTSPAQATVAECEQHLIGQGYTVGPEESAACRTGAEGPSHTQECIDLLRDIGVRYGDAEGACRRAAA
ncbi:hypothetical protein [Streptomyces specialis]|uniref:hypothetical protein n=1 Tax=Streptomyces specialis TaxID=498367 RepID=UPI00073EF683|nr:hypothetical protein [Streptomyces specialis]